MNILLKYPSVTLQDLGRLLVKRIFRVGLEEEVLQSVNDGIDGQNRLPILAEDVQANVSFEINVWVVDLRLTLHFRRLVRIRLTHFKTENELSASVEALEGENRLFMENEG